MTIEQKIKTLLDTNPVVLFVKGTRTFPQCGFSATAMKLLQDSGVSNFATVNVLEDPEMRQGIKDYGNWPTVPQLYVNGELIGGCDIMKEMYSNGELAEVLKGVGS